MGEVIYVKRVPKRMECCQCEGDEFSLHEDGTVRCWECDSVINVTWARSSSPPSDAAPSASG